MNSNNVIVTYLPFFGGSGLIIAASGTNGEKGRRDITQLRLSSYFCCSCDVIISPVTMSSLQLQKFFSYYYYLKDYFWSW